MTTDSMTRLGDVETWWDVHGAGDPLVLLHPGGADSRAYDLNLDGLAAAFRTYRFDRRGQGRTPDVGGPITFADMTDDTIAFIETVVGEPVHLLGHSIGAPVGLLVAFKRPDLVRGLVFSEGVFHYEGWLPGVLDPLPPDVHEFLGGLYGEVSPHGARALAGGLGQAGRRAPPGSGADDRGPGGDRAAEPADVRRQRGRGARSSTSTRCTGRCRTPSSRSSPAPDTACWPTSPTCATG